MDFALTPTPLSQVWERGARAEGSGGVRANHTENQQRHKLLIWRQASFNHLIDQAIFLGLMGRHEIIPIHVFFDLGDRLTSALGIDTIELMAQP
jgi:hypothetical protein